MKFGSKGQIAIFIALSFSLVALLLAMVINIGFLVNAKINLQNATDLAAYAGAAEQARYLTEIGKWNYEMRRNYKAFAYDYMIAYNAERNDFDKYVKTNNGVGRFSYVCATLQRQTGVENADTLKKTCQLDEKAVQDFSQQLEQAQSVLGLSIMALGFAAGAGSVAAPLSASAVAHAATVVDAATNLEQKWHEQFRNYLISNTATTNQINQYKYNYNHRLLAWTVHDYRQMQSRIRGVHFGTLDINKRLDVTKTESEPVIFKNSPVSVAAKVLNGYTDPDNAGPNIAGNGYIDLDDPNIRKNPVHNAAYNTFKKNLLNVTRVPGTLSKIYHLVPRYDEIQGVNPMGSGCNGKCNEFKGPYLRLLSHDVSFYTFFFTAIHQVTQFRGQVFPVPTSSAGARNIGLLINNFPVGVAKDDRVQTYYAVAGLVSTRGIPFNVFFGTGSRPDKYSEAPPLVAVAAARPFGSRIGPFVNDDCNDTALQNMEQSCINNNGFDPLYPNPRNTMRPNFSVNNEDKELGVKLSVFTTGNQHEAEMGTVNHCESFGRLYCKSRLKKGRWRFYQQNNRKKDDGFILPLSENPSPSVFRSRDPGFYDADEVMIHPQGNRNSIFAWKNDLPSQPPLPPVPQAQRNNYEQYFQRNTGQAVTKHICANGCETPDGLPYNIYTFKYPVKGTGDLWDMKLENGNSMTLNPRKMGDRMEQSFANTMAVNRFELTRYILPHNYQYGGLPSKYSMDWLNQENKEGYIFLGRNTTPKNQRFEDIIPFDNSSFGTDLLRSMTPGKDIHESFTAWRVGLRGYRVKMITVSELVESVKRNNPLLPSYTLPVPGGVSKISDITIELDKINM